MAKLPKKCLTCKFMEFFNDEDDSPLICTLSDEEVEEDLRCGSYEADKEVLKDAEMGMWQ